MAPVIDAILDAVPSIAVVRLAATIPLLFSIFPSELLYEVFRWSRPENPLALAGFLVGITFLIFLDIASRIRLKTPSSAESASILRRIITYMFVLALIAIILGFIAFVVQTLAA